MTPLLLRVLRDPAAARTLDLAGWDLLVRQARSANLLASLDALLDEHGMLEGAPAGPVRHLAWARAVARKHREAVHWEVAQIRAALAQVRVPLVLLKGAAYVMADLPTAQGRLFNDIDILVTKESLGAVEAALMLAGWATTHHDAYDQRYYRQWMHELPPMRHVQRLTVIDVHHAILPESGRLRPDPARLLAGRVQVPGKDVAVFGPADMVLHSAVHLFHDGELDHGLRDLFDLHRLLLHFAAEPGFWPRLTARAAELGLLRPLFYALRYCGALLHTPVPEQALQAAQEGAPAAPLLALMDALFLRALLPVHASCADRITPAARFALYLRANWLRMPPLLLTRHLLRKAFVSPREA